MATTFRGSVPSSCSMSQLELHTKMSPTGIATWSVFVRIYQSSCAEIKSISRTEK